MHTIDRKIKPFAVLIPLIYFAIIMSWQYRLPGISADGQIYLQIARNIHYGIGLGWQALWASPLHSILIALIAWLPGVHDLQFAAGVESILMGALLTVSLYSLATAIFDWKVGVMATMVVLSFPHVINMHFTTEPEITYTAFLLASLTLLLFAVEKDSFPLAVLTGISFALTYLSRSEGFLIMALTLSVLCATQGFNFLKTRLTRVCLPIVIAFFITSAPYLHFLQKHYGSFVISPKATYVLIWMKDKIYHDNDKGELNNDELWGLTPEGKLKWQQPSSIVDLASFLMSHPSKSISVYLNNLSHELPGRIPNSSGFQHFPQVYPIYIALLALVAAFIGWGKDSTLKKAVVFSPLLILLILPVFTGGWFKYLLPYAPLLIISACGGLFLISEKLVEHIGNPRLRCKALLMPKVIAFVLVVSFLSVFMRESHDINSNDRLNRFKNQEYMINAARMARQQYGPGRNYMVSWNKMIYYLDGLWTPLPVTTEGHLIEFALKNNVDYIVREFYTTQISQEEITREVPQGLRINMIHMSEDKEYGVIFYELLDRCIND